MTAVALSHWRFAAVHHGPFGDYRRIGTQCHDDRIVVVVYVENKQKKAGRQRGLEDGGQDRGADRRHGRQ